MQNFTLYRDPGSIQIELHTYNNLHHIKKVRSINDQAFLLNTRNELFTGLVNASASYVELKLLRSSIVDFDIDCKDQCLYIVDDNGAVYRSTHPFEKNESAEIVVPNPKSCVHGCRRPKLKIAKVCVNEDGILFVTVHHELYGMGRFEDVVTSDVPVRVECFAGFKILQVVAGANFVVVLTYKKPHIGFDDISDEESDTSNHFNSNCSQCSPNTEPDAVLNDESTPLMIAESSCENQSSGRLEELGSSEINKQLKIDVAPVSDQRDDVKTEEMNNEANSLNDSSVMSSSMDQYASDFGSVADLMGNDVESDIIKICRIGANMLGTGVWCFGSVNTGHLGTGDHIKRTRINQVLGLTGQGVVKVCCGYEHSVAITLDGRLFLWGNNSEQQISTEEIGDVSSPRRYRNAQNVLDVACGSYSTIILHNDLQIKEICKQQSESSQRKKTFKYLENDESKSRESTSFILASQNILIQNHSTLATIEKHLNGEQKFLQETLTTYQSILKPFRKKLYFINKNPTIDHLCQQYLNILNMTAVNLKTMIDYYNGIIGHHDILSLMSSTEMTAAYRAYTTCFCDVVVMQGFSNENFVLGKVKDPRKLFMAPFQRVWCYVDFICHLLDTTSQNNAYLDEKRSVWEKYKIEKDLAIELADKTSKFWETNGKSLAAKLQSSERRLIMDSKEFVLKLMASNRFSSHWFILFSDVFCHYAGNSLQILPLNTLWISSLLDIENRKNSFKIISPEDCVILLAQDLDTKIKWMEAIELGIKSCLELSALNIVPKFRNTAYTFSEKHLKYPRARYIGQWWCGQMQGIGRLDFHDGRAYTGQLSNNEISGMGKMYDNSMGGLYEGEFLNGKYHGHGVLDLRNKETYEGNFKDGAYHGHGVLRTNDFTYIGEFVNNSKNGYGVLDDAINGDKYMGMFVDNKKCGFGMLITTGGSYFEGTFVNDSLAGYGIAFLQNGSYFEGELTLLGPNGKGNLNLPTSELKSETIELEDRKIEMVGNISSGTFTGIWDEIKVSHGTISMNQTFPKYPKSLGRLSSDFNMKWRSLFQDWESSVFGSTVGVGTTQIWNKIAVYITISKRKEKMKSEEFSHDTLFDGRRERNDKFDSSSLKSNNSVYSQYSLRSNRELHTKLHNFNEKTDLIKEKTNLLKNELNETCSNKEVLYDNLKSQDPNLLEIFKLKKDSSQNMLNKISYDFTTESGKPRKSVTAGGSLDYIPCYGLTELEQPALISIKDYLMEAFKDQHHPLGVLNSKISFCFYTSYGCWKVKPTSILSRQAMTEWEMISKRIYGFVRKMFPALPLESDNCDGEIISHQSLLYPILLSEGVYSTLFVLYASKCSQNDEIYRQRTSTCDKKSDKDLISFLRIESNLLPMIRSNQFENAIMCLKQVKEQYCPRQMLNQIENTFKLIDEAKCEVLGKSYILNADNIMPLTIFLIIRAGIPHLGAELLLLEDLMGSDFEPVMLGFGGYCFATVKATYQHILSDKFFQD